VHGGRQPVGLRYTRHHRQRHEERPNRCRVLIEISSIWLKQLCPPLDGRGQVAGKVRRLQRQRRCVELGPWVREVHHEFAASQREAQKFVEVSRQLHPVITHQIFNPRRQWAPVEELVEFDTSFLVLILADEQAQAMPGQRVICGRTRLDRA
jgi:hypothetical protein